MVHLQPYQFEPNATAASVQPQTVPANAESGGATGTGGGASSGKRATVCRPMPDDGTVSAPAGRARTCRLRMTFFEMPPYLIQWTKAGHSKLLNVPEHLDRIRSVPALRASSALPANSQQYMPPNEHYYDLVRLPNDDNSDDDGVERFELRWRFDAIFRIAAPLNMKLPFVPASTSRRIITSPV